MDPSQLLRIRMENMPKFIRNNPTTDSSTLTWKHQLQAAAGTRKTSIYTEVCDAFKPEPISNHYIVTTIGANTDYQQTLLYNAGKQVCGCAGESPAPLYQYISNPTLTVPANPIKGQNPAGPCVCNYQTFSQRVPLTICPCSGKDRSYPSG